MKNIIKDLNVLEGFIFDNIDEINKKFLNDKCWELVGATFSSEYVHIVYILDCGQHVSDLISIYDFLNFYSDKYL